jgi:hypothetical protein
MKINKRLQEADKAPELKSQETISPASGDQNQITGLLIAKGRVHWEAYGPGPKDQGYVFKKNHGFAFKVDDNDLLRHGVSMDAITDCIKELEKLGPPEALRKLIHHRKDQGPLNAGLVVLSTVDPRIKMSCTFVSSDTEETDFWVGFYLDVERLDIEMKTTNDKYQPERPADPEELKVVDRAREANPVVNQTKEEDVNLGEEEKLLGLVESLPRPLIEKIRSDKPTYLVEDVEPVTETGEADQDYDHDVYDAIANALEDHGFQATHREFDKYQGVYFDVRKNGKKIGRFWNTESFVTGKTKPQKTEFSSAVMISPDGDEFSATQGDYFNLPKDHVFKDTKLILKRHDGTKKVIRNPKVKDLPDLLSVSNSIEYEGKPDDVLVFEGEGGGPAVEVKVSADGKNVDIGEFVSLLNGELGESKKLGGAMSDHKDLSEDYQRVDFWGVPIVEDSTPIGSGKKVGTAYGEKPAKKPVYAQDTKQYDKKVDNKAENLPKDKSIGDPTPMKAGDALEKPNSEEGEEYHEKPGGNKNQLGDPKSGVGDHMQAKGKSDDQQDDVAKNKIKPGAVDAKPKVMGEAGDDEPEAMSVLDAAKALLAKCAAEEGWDKTAIQAELDQLQTSIDAEEGNKKECGGETMDDEEKKAMEMSKKKLESGHDVKIPDWAKKRKMKARSEGVEKK